MAGSVLGLDERPQEIRAATANDLLALEADVVPSPVRPAQERKTVVAGTQYQGNSSGKIIKASKIEARVREYFPNDPVMVRIAWCESRFRQYNPDGSVLRGEITPRDVGVMQINEFFHLDAAVRLGYDIHTLEGNLAYAKWLYGREGSQPWYSSAHCWRSHDLAHR